MRSVTLKSAMTPSFMGLIATMLPGVRPSISLASLPTASTSPVFLLSATMDGSLTTMPLPLANTKVFAVPKSMARSDENRLNRERRFIKDVRYELEGRRLHAVKASHLNASIFCAFRTSNRKAGTSACRTLDPPFTACGRSLDGAPGAVLANPLRPAVYVLMPESGAVCEIDAAKLAVARKTRLGNPAVAMRLAADGKSLWVLQPRALVRLEGSRLRAVQAIA